MKKPYLSFLSPQFRCAQSKAYDLRNSRSDIISKSLPLSRSFHQISRSPASLPPKSRNRGPPSSEDTQTDFSALNVLGNATPPTTGIDACTHNGFVLNNDIRLAGCGVILVGGEAFKWRPWLGGSERRDGKNTAENKTLAENLQDFIGRWEAHDAAWGILDTVWPKPGSRMTRSCSQALLLKIHRSFDSWYWWINPACVPQNQTTST